MFRPAALTQRPTRKAPHEALLVKAVAALSRYGEASLSIGELSRLVGVSERTLRSAFAATLGISPTRYLILRRLHLLRAALSIANPLTDTVASIAHTFGFSDCGRMAAQYRNLFGENPSITLLRRISTPAGSGPEQEHADDASSAKATRQTDAGRRPQNGQSPTHRRSHRFH